MIHFHTLLPISVVLLSLAACTTSGPASLQTPTSLFSSTAAPAASSTPDAGTSLIPAQTVQAPAHSGFTVAVIVDGSTEQVTREQAQGAIAEAGTFLREFSPIGLEMVDFSEDAGGGSTADIASRYMTAHPATLPDGLVIFSYGDNGQARSSGGYGYSLPGPAGFKNIFVSPVVGDNQIYVAVVEFGYKYMACGYGGSDAAQSAVSLPGECRGETGIACVSNNGYSMCSNAVGNLYTSTPTHAVSSMIVHSLLHNFSPGGDTDHYATPECNARMGYPAGFFDLQESEYYNDLCPYVYEEFTKSYQP